MNNIYNMPDQKFQEKILIMYQKDDWCSMIMSSSEKRLFSDYFEYSEQINHIGKLEKFYRLTAKGKLIGDFLMLMFDRPTETGGSGIALEKREWSNIQQTKFKHSEIVKSLKDIGKRGNVPTDVQKHNNYTKVVIQDVDRAISRISFEISWELRKTQGKEYLKTQGFNDCMCWLWTDYLDRIRVDLRKIPFQQEFVVWHS